MTTQLLIYESVVPLTFATHRHSSVEIGRNFAFSGKINSVPLTAIEFRDAQSDYPIVFAGNKEAVLPAVILGLRDGENLYLSGDGKWDARYIPAFVRRYPFVFAKSDDGERFNLCIDEQFSGFNGNGRGHGASGDNRLFTGCLPSQNGSEPVHNPAHEFIPPPRRIERMRDFMDQRIQIFRIGQMGIHLLLNQDGGSIRIQTDNHDAIIDRNPIILILRGFIFRQEISLDALDV